MSPVSRGRQGRRNKKKSTRRTAPPDVFDAPDACDCPACSGEDFDPQQLIDELVAGAADLAGCDDPLEAEIAGAAFEEALVDGFIPEIEARATAGALAMLLAIGSVAQGRAGKEASAAADRLAEA